MKKKKGFKFKNNGTTYRVYFQSFNKRIVKCNIFSIDSCLEMKEFTGMAKCNVDAGDKFIESVGMTISFARALRELEVYLEQQLKKQKKLNKFSVKGIGNKYITLVLKEKLGYLD